MKTLSVGEFKTHFSEALEDVRRGKTVGVAYGRKGDLVALLVPPNLFLHKAGVKLGSLKGRARFLTKADFKISDEELLGS